MIDPTWGAAARGSMRDRVELSTVAAATALLVVAASANVLVVASSGQAAIEQVVTAAPGAGTGGDTADIVVTLPDDAPAIGTAVEERLATLAGYEQPVRQRTSIRWLVLGGIEDADPVVRVDDAIVPAVLFHRAGAIESVEVVAGPDPAGQVWLPSDLADELGLRPGDPLEVGLEPVGSAGPRTGAATVLAGTYATVDGRPTGTLADESIRLPPDPEDLASPAPLVLADLETMRLLGAELDDRQLETIQVAPVVPPRYEDLRRGVDQLDEIQFELVTPTSELGNPIFEQFNAPVVEVATGARRLTTRAAETAAVVGERIVGAAVAGVVLAALTLVAAGAAGARRRREHTRLELVQGSATTAVAARAAITAAPAVVVGAVMGRLLALPLAELVLPAERVPAPAVEALWPRTVVVALAALVAVFVVRLADASSRLATLDGQPRARSLPVVPVLIAVATVVVLGAVVGPSRPPTDPLVMAMPVVVIAAVSVVVLRGLVRFVPDRADQEVEPTAAWLARRRAAGQSSRLVAVGTVVAIAAGLVAHTAVLRASGGVAVEAKTAALAGAPVVVAVPGPEQVDSPAVASPRTVVFADPRVDVRPTGGDATLVAVDPESFAAVASWPTGTGPEVLDALADADGAALPVVVVEAGGPVTDGGAVERTGWWSLSYEVVARPPALPGAEPGSTLLVTSQEALFARLDAELDPRRRPSDPESGDPDGPWVTEVWFDTGVDEAVAGLTVVLQDSGRRPRLVSSLADVRAEPRFLATTWSLGVLTGLAVVVLALALLLVGGTRARAADEAGLELEVLARLGVSLRRQRAAALLERVLLVLVAGIVGAATGTGLAATVAAAADPAPGVAPPLTVVVPVTVMVALVATLVLAGVAAGLLDHRAARRADVEEALRVAA